MEIWSFIHLLPLFAWFSRAQKVPQSPETFIEDYQRQLQEAALDVLQQYSEDSYQSDYLDDGPPIFHMPPDFMHAFRTNTGVGNREDLVIDRIRNIPVFDDATFSKWQYIRFNNSDFVLGISMNDVILWQKSINPMQPLHFGQDEGIFRYQTEGKGVISDAVMFIRNIFKTDILYVAILTETKWSSFISIYEIIDGKGLMITVIDLGFSTIVEDVQPSRKLSYVKSRHGSAVVVLVANAGEEKIVYQRKGSNVLNHYIEIRYPSAFDLVSFTVSGHGYIAATNKTVCTVYKMDEFVQNHWIFEKIYFNEDIVDLEAFRLGFHWYLAVSATNYQNLFVWRSGGFSGAQEFHSSGVLQVFTALLPNCRDDVILFFIKYNLPHDLFVWNGQQEKFIPVQLDMPESLLPWPSTMTSFSYGSSVYLLFVHQHGMSQLYAIDTHLSPFPDPVLLLGKEVSDLMQELQATINEQASKIRSMSETLSFAVLPNQDQQFTSLQAFTNFHLESLEAEVVVNDHNIIWEGSSISLQDYLAGTGDLEARIAALEKGIDELEALLPDVVLADEDAIVTGAKIFAGVVHGSEITTHSLSIQTAGGIYIPQLMSEIYRLDRPETIRGSLKVENLTILGDLNVETTVNGIVLSEDVMTTDTAQVSNAHMVFERRVTIRDDLAVSGKVNDVNIGAEVVTLYNNHIITGRKTFKSGIVAHDVQAAFIDGVDVNKLFSEAMTISGAQNVTGFKHFTGTLHTQDIELTGTVNNFDINKLAGSIVRVDVPASLSDVTFLDDVIIESDLNVRGTVNNLMIPQDLFLKNEQNVVTGKKDFYGIVIVNDIIVLGTVDGLVLPDDVITLSKDEFLNITLYFSDGISVAGDVIVHGLVDGMNIVELAQRALKQNETRYIDTAEFFGPVTITGDLDIHGTVNGVLFSDMVTDIVYKDDKDVVIKSKKHFTKITAKTVEVKKSINGYDIRHDFMTVDGDQTIYGKKIFQRPVTFHSITTANDMIGPVNITSLYRNHISLSLRQDIIGDINFVDHLVINGDLRLHGTLDGLIFPDDFVLASTDQELSNKVFHGTVSIDNLVVAGDFSVSSTFGGLRLPEFYHQRVTLSGNEEIEGDLYLGNVTAEFLEISGLVNGMDIVDFANNVMSLTKDQNITAYKEFTGLTTVHGPITTSKGVNGINLAQVKHRAFKLHEENIVTAPLTFEDAVIFKDLIVTGLINRVNLTQLDEDSVRKEGLQVITGVTTFLKGFHVNGDILASSVNGLIIPQDILTKNTPQTITGTYTLKDTIIYGNVNVKGLVNNMDISEISPLLARIDQHNVVYSDVVFAAPIEVFGELDVSGLVNGINLKHLEQSAMQKAGEQHVPGHKILRGNVSVYGDVDVKFVNGIDWENFLQNVVRIDVPQTISGTKAFESDLEVHGDVHVSGYAEIESINSIKLIEFVDDIVFINQPADITGTKVFTQAVEIAGDLNAVSINGLDLKRDVITLLCGDTDPQVITGEKTFQDLEVLGDIFVDGYVNGYKLNELASNTLSIDGDQVITGHKTFYKTVKFSKDIITTSVNGLVVNNDLVTLDTDQDIYGSLTFQNDVHVSSDLIISGLLNGFNLRKLTEEAVYVDTEQVIKGEYAIDLAFVKQPVFVDGPVNGINLQQFSQDVNTFWDERNKDLTLLMNMTEEQCEIVQHLHSSLQHSFYMLDGFLTHQVINASADYVEVKSDGKVILIKKKNSGPVADALLYKWRATDNLFHFSKKKEVTVVQRKVFKFGSHEIVILIGVQPKESVIKIDENRIPAVQRGFFDADAAVLRDKAIIAALYRVTETSPEIYCEVFEVIFRDGHNPKFGRFGTLNVVGATSLAVFEMSGFLHLAFSCDFSPHLSQGSSKIYAFIEHEWKVIQNIMAPASSHVLHFHYHGYHYLGFTNAVPVHHFQEPKAIQIYRSTAYEEVPFNLFQKIPFDNAKRLGTFEFGGIKELYLTVFNDTKVQVFRLEGEAGFQTNFTLKGKCIYDVQTLLLGTDVFLIVGQNPSEAKHIHISIIYRGLTKGSALAPRDFQHCS